MESQGSDLLAALIDADDGMDQVISMNLPDDVFVAEEQDAFKFIIDFMMKHGSLPARETLEDNGWELPTVVEPASYYLEVVEKRHLHQTMRRALRESMEFLKKKKREEAFEVVSAFCLEQMQYRHRHDIIDFATQGLKMVKTNYIQKIAKGDDFGIRTGWEYLDNMTNGLLPGDLFILVGKTKAGKTYLMLWMAHHAWHVHKKKIMFVSMEMQPTPLMNRIAAMHAKVPITMLNHAELTTAAKKKFNTAMLSIGDDVPFYIVDGNLTASVKDIALLAQQLKPDAIYIDGAYMLQPSNPRMEGWKSVVDTARGMKSDLSTSLGIPVFASYQFNKEGAKTKKSEGLGVHSVAGSQEIAWLATVLLGMTEEDTVENMARRKVDILAGRNGEVGSWWINWIFDKYPYMDFSEIVEKKNEGLAYE